MTFSPMRRAITACSAFAVLAYPLLTLAADPVKIGLIAPFSGSFADYGKQMEGGIKAWQKLNGDVVAGRKIEVIMKDTTGPVPEVAKRLAQELVVRDKTTGAG